MRAIVRFFPLVALIPAIAAGACTSSTDNQPDGGLPSAEAGTTPDASPTAEAEAAAPPPPAAGGTGAFGIVTINGKQKMYLPEQSADPDHPDNNFPYIAVIDVGAAGNGAAGAPALITRIDLTGADAGDDPGSEWTASATGGDSNMVIAVSKDNPRIWFIDPNTDTLIKKVDLDTSVYGTSYFSGGGGYVTGVAIDSPNHRAILSVWNGFALVDLTTQTITTVIEAPPSENFGYDSAHQRIIAPFYRCTESTLAVDGASVTPSTCTKPVAADGTNITEGLSIIDLADNNNVYTYLNLTVDGGASESAGATPYVPVGSEPDSAAADPSTGLVVVASEGDGYQSLIDLSMATFDKNKLIVTAPQKVVPDFDMDGVAVEYTSHYGFWEQEGEDDVGVANLMDLNAGSTAWVHGHMPTLPIDDAGNGGGGFGNFGDPHGIAVTTGVTTQGPVGFVVNSLGDWVARIDLTKMLAAGMDDAGDASTELDSTAMAPFVTYLSAETKE
jgi:hypothetical protein